jgi:hypothetical protein
MLRVDLELHFGYLFIVFLQPEVAVMFAKFANVLYAYRADLEQATEKQRRMPTKSNSAVKSAEIPFATSTHTNGLKKFATTAKTNDANNRMHFGLSFLTI